MHGILFAANAKVTRMPTSTLEEYLESIYKLGEKGVVRPTMIAESVGVSGPTVTATLKRLQARGLITRSKSAVELTNVGQREALDIVRRHRLDVLGMGWDEAHEDACLLDHALSPRVQAALEGYLDNPSVCPHGHPIPSAEGVIEPVVGDPLCDVGTNGEGRIVQVAEDNDELLQYLGSLGMFPGTDVKVCEVAPFNGPLLIEVNGSRYAIARDIASKILVTR
jgi:DtxR family Mn-dependent transcriptional regulator